MKVAVLDMRSIRHLTTRCIHRTPCRRHNFAGLRRSGGEVGNLRWFFRRAQDAAIRQAEEIIKLEKCTNPEHPDSYRAHRKAFSKGHQ